MKLGIGYQIQFLHKKAWQYKGILLLLLFVLFCSVAELNDCFVFIYMFYGHFANILKDTVLRTMMDINVKRYTYIFATYIHSDFYWQMLHIT